jgi:hypothetical protein
MVDVIVLDDDPIYIVANLKKENRTPSAGARDGVGD